MTAATDETATEKVRECEDALRTLAESDLPAARWAERLLALIDEPADRPGGGGR